MAFPYTVALFGHRRIENFLAVEACLEEQIRDLMKERKTLCFLVGRNGDFDQCAASTILRLQRAFPSCDSRLVLVLPYPTAEYQKNTESFHRYYDDVEISMAASVAHPKSAIQIRNREMVDRADQVICYVENGKGGAAQTLRYAEKQGKGLILIHPYGRSR
ncbi:MAG: hypothetical protein IKD31_07410 [Clostridia bacterium]|nr:hypothetical protein [Clostridia bacterium]